MGVSRRSAILIAALFLLIFCYASPGVCAESRAGQAGLDGDDVLLEKGIRYSDGRVTGEFKNVSVGEILREIAKESGFSIYGIEAVSNDVISIRLRAQPVEDSVRRVLRAAGVNNYAMFYRSCPESDGFEVKKIVFLSDEVNLSQPSVATKAPSASRADRAEELRKRREQRAADASKKRSRAASKREKRQRKAQNERKQREEALDEVSPLPFPPEDLLRGHPLLDMLSSGDFKDQRELMDKFTESLNTTNPEDLQRLFEPLMEGGGAGPFSSPEDLEAMAEEMLSEFLQNQ